MQGSNPKLVLYMVFATVLALAACTDRAPEARLESAGEQLQDTSQNLIELEQEIQNAETHLKTLQKQRRTLTVKVQSLEERLQNRATDVAIFRSLQSQLLNNEALKETAISVEVEDRRITLNGLVSTEEQVAEALATAKSIPGATSIRSQIQIEEIKE
tara:strand:- start:661 stop:1134 length:474 start_codon:yes stop_codon:yes gene_type:complete